MLKIMCIVGVRPNFVKLAGLIDALSDMKLFIVHTGQHYDHVLDGEFWHDLQLPDADANLRVGSGSHIYQLTQTISQLEPFIGDFKPDGILVVGDANPSLAGALAANKMGVDVIHVEAGLRSFDNSMPEEINRKLVDGVSSLLFVTEQSGMNNLKNGCWGGAHLVGNVMVDTLRKNKDRIDKSDIIERLDLDDYVLCTLHRPSNVDGERRRTQIEDALLRIKREHQIVMPQHPRTKLKYLKTFQPAKYTDFIKLLACAKMVITDSGGVQEEALALETPCLTLRDSTERPITLERGCNRLVEPDGLYTAFRETLGTKFKFELPALWDGHASERIAKIIKVYYGDKPK